MARTVANLAVSISARTRGLSKGLKRAKAEVAGFAASVAKTVAGIGAVGAVAGAGIALGTKNQIASLSELAKTARKLSDIEPTSLIAMRDLAQQSRVEVKTLDMGLQRMLRRIQEASAGKGEAVSVLKELGLDAKQLIKLKPDEQFVKVADAMKKIEGDGRNLARLMKLFDSEGVALGNTFASLGKDGLKPFIEEVRRSGREVTKNQLKPIESVEDRWFRLSQRIGGLFTRLAVDTAKPMDNMLKQVERFMRQKDTVVTIRDAFKGISEAIKEAPANLEKMVMSVKAFGVHVARILKAIGIVSGGAMAAIDQANNAKGGTAVERLENILKGGPSSTEIMNTAVDDAVRVLGDTPDKIKTAIDTGLKSGAQAIRDSVEKATTAVQGGLRGGSGGQVMRLERNGKAIPFGSSLGQPAAMLDEQRKQTSLLERISRGTNPSTLPAGTMIIQVAG